MNILNIFQPGVPPFNFEGCLTRVGWSAQASRATVAEPGVQGAWGHDDFCDEDGDDDYEQAMQKHGSREHERMMKVMIIMMRTVTEMTEWEEAHLVH